MTRRGRKVVESVGPRPTEYVTRRRLELGKLSRAALLAEYGRLPGRTPRMAASTNLSDAVLVDLVIWVESAPVWVLASMRDRKPT